MLLGLDLDNTLVCYDHLFWRLAHERGQISAEVPHRKECVRDEFRRTGREAEWTLLQGEVYGPRMIDAEPFPYVLSALTELVRAGWELRIISHRSRTPYAGPAWDLHATAREWLAARGFLDHAVTGLSTERVHLETDKAGKLSRIASLGCDWFIDDLPELLTDDLFPAGVRRLLFDPHQHRPHLPKEIGAFHDWLQVTRALAGAAS